MRLPVLLLALFAAPLSQAQTPAHTAEAPTILEGPQAAGTAPKPAAPDPSQLSNDAVLRMHRAGLTDDLILQTITTQPGQFDTSADALITLKQSGLSDAILSAITDKSRRQITGTPLTPIDLSPVNEIGVYYKDRNGRWTPMDSEVVHVKSGGFLKSTLTDGIIKPDRNGVVSGRESKLLLPRPIEILIFTADGVTADEYDFVRFRLNSKDREFRTLTGGVIHSTGGAQRDEVAFTPKKIAPRTWTFTLDRDTTASEYGILPPGTGNVTNGGKIYTFAISE